VAFSLSQAEATVLAEEATDKSETQVAKKAQHNKKTAWRNEAAAESDEDAEPELVPSCSPGDGSKRKNIKAVLSDEDYGAMAKQVSGRSQPLSRCVLVPRTFLRSEEDRPWPSRLTVDSGVRRVRVHRCKRMRRIVSRSSRSGRRRVRRRASWRLTTP